MSRVKLAETAALFEDGDWIESKDQDRDGGIRLIQLADIGAGEFIDKSSRFLTADTAKRLRCTFLQPGDILIARMPEPIGRACVFPEIAIPCITAVDVCILRVNESADRDYVMYYINSPDFRRMIMDRSKGATRQRISRKDLGELPIELPLLEEQRRIVGRIKEATERLREIDNLRGEANVEAMRLGQACRFDCWLEMTARYASKPLRDITESAKNGLYKPAKFYGSGVSFVRMFNIVDGKFTSGRMERVQVDGKEQESYRLQKGDILVSRVNSRELVGKSCMFPGYDEDAVFEAMVIRLRCGAGINSGYVSSLMNSPQFLHVLRNKAKHAIGQSSINQQDLLSSQLPIPPLKVQEAVWESVQEIDDVSTSIQLEQQARDAEAKLIEQTILRKAFAGEL